MSSLDSLIDVLYQQPLDQFIAARNALAKSLKGDEGARVRALAKPTIVPWAVNQLYWHARPLYDRLLASGVRLRAAQIATLQGSSPDVPGAASHHRQAVADAVAQARRLAAAAGAAPDPDALMRTCEALSLASTPPAAPGRLTGALQPAGFEALAGVKPAVSDRATNRRDAPAGAQSGSAHPMSSTARPSVGTTAVGARPSAADLKRERDAEVARRAEIARQAEIAKATAALARVESDEQAARQAWERAHDALLAARRALFTLKSGT